MKWYESFFDGVAMEFWKAGVPPEWTQSEVGFLWDALGLKAGASVLGGAATASIARSQTVCRRAHAGARVFVGSLYGP